MHFYVIKILFYDLKKNIQGEKDKEDETLF